MSGPAHADAAHFDDAFAVLAARARRRNLDRTDRVLALLAAGAPAVGHLLDPAARDEAMQLCHAVAGSAGTFGEHDLSDAARRLETALRDGPDDAVTIALDGLRAAAGRTP
ncbi:Hpt domain-containing protein [Puerhibacterium sp. TATVAM-FAB25]|uniref:Hpt domain-containing protein n=1 Tax=Puerhibacterium sp. TATVAM-FAB25 TaxID=3093699 RepID=UPI00397B63BA